MARVRGVYASIGGGAQSHFSHTFTAGLGRLPQCHCMLAGESMISSNMTFYRTQKLRVNVPHTYLCLIIRNKIGLLLELANIGLFKWSRLIVTSFSPFNNRVIYLDFLFNGS